MSETLIQSLIGLDKSSRKFNCPRCGKKRFVRMYDFTAKEYLPDEVGRCDREGGCGYHMTAKQYFESKGLGYKPKSKEIEIKPEVIDYLPFDFVQQTMKGYDKNNFVIGYESLFGNEIAKLSCSEYSIGTSKYQHTHRDFPEYKSATGSTIFWQIDIDGKVRSGKVILYDADSFKRVKQPFDHVTWIHTLLKKKGYNLKQCFFGEYLLSKYPNKTVGILESEKSAIVASIYLPDMVWLATGGSGACLGDSSVFKVLKGRDVILFPDFGFYNKETGKTCYQKWEERSERIKEIQQCSITVSRILEDELPESDRTKGSDLADYLICRSEGKGWALEDDNSYPIFWDLLMKIKGFESTCL
ncbi:MAG TPA: DUF6371 domain-containing protein [Chitinophagaceae bacterium]|nr:DUF6371 domain-containing protein [Chitinophagaceae bacterium]